jgi:hypothetical protein
MADSTTPHDDDVIAEFADAADADERTLIRYLAGLPVRGRVAWRIERAIAARGGERLGSILTRSLARIRRVAGGGNA